MVSNFSQSVSKIHEYIDKYYHGDISIKSKLKIKDLSDRDCIIYIKNNIEALRKEKAEPLGYVVVTLEMLTAGKLIILRNNKLKRGYLDFDPHCALDRIIKNT